MLCGNKIDIQREVKTEEGQKLAEKEKMLFFEVSAKNSINVSHMIYSCIAELPFFAQLEIKDKNRLIEELEAVNKNREQNSFLAFPVARRCISLTRCVNQIYALSRPGTRA